MRLHCSVFIVFLEMQDSSALSETDINEQTKNSKMDIFQKKS